MIRAANRWISAAALLLFPLPLFLFPASLGAQTVTLAPTDIPGLEAFGQDDQRFTELLSRFFPDRNDWETLQPLLRYAIGLRNVGSRDIAFLAIRYDHENYQGRPVHGVIRMESHGRRGRLPAGSAPLVVANTMVDSVRAGEFLLTNLTRMTAWLSQIPGAPVSPVAMFAQSPYVEISVDAIVFSDGEASGPDQSGSIDTMNEPATKIRALLTELAAAGKDSGKIEKILGAFQEAEGIDANPASILRNGLDGAPAQFRIRSVFQSLTITYARGGVDALQARVNQLSRSSLAQPLEK